MLSCGPGLPPPVALVLSVQRHLPLLAEGGLFLPLVHARTVRKSEGFLVEPMQLRGECFNSSSRGKVVLAKRVRCEMRASGRMGKGGRTSRCVVARGQQSLVSPALLYCLFKGLLSGGRSLNAVERVGRLQYVVHRLSQWGGGRGG